MENITAVYCMKNKKDRNSVEMYQALAELLNRQEQQGGELHVSGLYEAKKAFRCRNTDPYQKMFEISAGEYFLLVEGSLSDTNTWRLHRACRSEQETHSAWPLVGIPAEEVLEDSREENDHFRCVTRALLPVAEQRGNTGCSGNYLCAHEIKEAVPGDREDTWCIAAFTEKDFAHKPNMLELYPRITSCRCAEELLKVVHSASFLEYTAELFEKRFGKLAEHHSLVIGVIDGSTGFWLCGGWFYKAPGRDWMKLEMMDRFAPDGYTFDPEVGAVPFFRH